MSSPNKKQGKFDNPFEASSFIRYATIKSKDELEDYYSRNKSKLPPILQSRNIFIQHLSKANPVKTDRMAELTKELHYHPTERTYESSKEPSEFAKNRSTELIPHLGKLIFDKDNPRKIKREYLVSYSSVERERMKSRKFSKENDIAKLERQKSSLITREKLKTEQIPRQEEISLIKLLKRIESRKQMLIEASGRTVPKKMASQDNRTNLMHINRVFTCVDQQKHSRMMMEGENQLVKGRKVSRQDMDSISYTRPVKQNSNNKKKMKKGKKISMRMNEDLQPWGQEHEAFLYSLAYIK